MMMMAMYCFQNVLFFFFFYSSNRSTNRTEQCKYFTFTFRQGKSMATVFLRHLEEKTKRLEKNERPACVKCTSQSRKRIAVTRKFITNRSIASGLSRRTEGDLKFVICEVMHKPSAAL